MEQNSWPGKWKKIKKEQLLIGVLVGILLLIIVLPQKEEKKTGQTENTQTENGTEEKSSVGELEREFQQLLSHVEGVGTVQVMITLSTSGKKTVEKDSSSSDSADSSDGENSKTTQTKSKEITTVFSRDEQGNEIPFIIEETTPEVKGVAVAAQGGDNRAVAENITDAAMVLFGIEAHKIKVMKLR